MLAYVLRAVAGVFPKAHGCDYAGVMATIFDVIADETRRSILAELRSADAVGQDGDGVSVGELVEKLGVSQPTVSKHLKVLREVGLVAVREVGQHRFYSLTPKPLAEVATWVAPYVADVVVTEAKSAATKAAEAAGDAVEEVLGTERYEQLGRSIGEAGASLSHAVEAAVDAVAEKVVKPVVGLFSRRR